MQTPRFVLNLRLNAVIDECRKDKKKLNQVKQIMLDKNVLTGSATSILNKNVPIETIEDINLLFIIANALHIVTHNEMVDPNALFTKSEIQKLTDFQYSLDSLNDNVYPKKPLVFKDVGELNTDHWMVKSSAKEISEMYARHLIKYNRKTQRNTVIQKINDVYVETINLNTNSVAQIKSLMRQGQFISNAITINILLNEKDDVKYYPLTRELVITSGELNIIDGFHRSMAMNELMQEFPELEYNTALFITNFSEDKARQFIKQENNRNDITKEHIQSLSSENLENIIVRTLNEHSLSELKGKITTNLAVITKGESLVLFSTLAHAIRENFNIEDKKDIIPITNFLIEGFNEILSLFKDKIKNKKKQVIETKGKAIDKEIHYNTFIGYTALLSQLINKENWRTKLTETLNRIDFSDNNEMWKEVLNYKNNVITTKLVRKISKNFIEILKEGGNINGYFTNYSNR